MGSGDMCNCKVDPMTLVQEFRERGVPCEVSTRGKLKTLRKIPWPIHDSMVPDALIRLRDEYSAGRVPSERLVTARARLRRYRLIPDLAATTPEVKQERAKRKRQYMQAYMRSYWPKWVARHIGYRRESHVDKSSL